MNNKKLLHVYSQVPWLVMQRGWQAVNTVAFYIYGLCFNKELFGLENGRIMTVVIALAATKKNKRVKLVEAR